MLKLKEVDPKILRAVRSAENVERGGGKTISYLLHIFSNMHEFNTGKSYLYVGNNALETTIAKDQFGMWLNESHIVNYHSKDFITAVFKIEPRKGLVGWYDALTKPTPPDKIEIEFMSVELGSGKLGTRQVDEVIVDVDEKRREYFSRELGTACAAGRSVYV